MSSSDFWWALPPAAINIEAVVEAEQRQSMLTKPPGALGRLESLAVRLAGLQGRPRPEIEQIEIVVFAGDHGVVDEGVDTLENLLAFGRQALFAHDNTHHTMFMAYSAVKCLGADGSFHRGRWAEMRKVFETHVVED